MISVTIRIIKQLLHDKRSLAMIILVPILLMSLLYLLLSKSNYIPKISYDKLPDSIISSLKQDENISVVAKDSDETNESYIKNKKADALVTIDKDGLHILMLEMDSVKVNAITDALKNTNSRLNPKAQMSVDFVYGSKNESTFDSIGFLILAILSFFMVFLISGISFVREQTSQTVERLMLTPIKSFSVVSGYVLGFSFFALIQSTLIILYSKFVLKMQFVGEWYIATVIMLLIAIVAVTMGILVSTLSKNEFQVMQFIPLIIVPQMFLCGLIPVETLPFNLSYLSKIMPLYYGSMGLKQVLVYGNGFEDVVFYILMLVAFFVLFFLANLIAIKKYRAV